MGKTLIPREQVFAECERQAPGYKLSPLLVYAVCLQEGQRDPKTGQFDASVGRLEQNFYRRYVMAFELATTSEILLAASYGVMQTMGESLRQMRFFEWYFDQASPGLQQVIMSPYSQFAVPSAIDRFCIELSWQVRFGCQWLDAKRRLAGGDEGRMLDLWNGDMTGKYRSEVLEKLQKVREGYR